MSISSFLRIKRAFELKYAVLYILSSSLFSSLIILNAFIVLSHNLSSLLIYHYYLLVFLLKK